MTDGGDTPHGQEGEENVGMGFSMIVRKSTLIPMIEELDDDMSPEVIQESEERKSSKV